MRLPTGRSESVVAACDQRDLLAFDLWPRQRELLASVEHGRLHVWALGRRSGKTTLAALAGLHDCLLRPELRAMVRPGERRYVVCVATNLRQARLFVRAALSIVERSPKLRSLVETVSDDEIEFRTGATLAAFPATSRGARGWPISTLLFDEAAHMLDSEGNQAAEPRWRSLVPSTSQFGSAARIIVASTPYGQDGLFASLYQQASSGELAGATATQLATADVNPTISKETLAAEELRDPDGYRSEYLAQFVGGGAAFLDPDRITDAVARRGELAPEDGVAWVAGLDPAFSSDPFGLCLVGRDPADHRRLIVGLAQAWRPTRKKAVSFEERREIEDAVLAEVAAVCLRYGAKVVTDQYAARPIVDYLRRRRLDVRTVAMTATSKTAAFGEVRARLNTSALELYEHVDLLAELRRLRTRHTAGAASVINPRVGGSHGDLVQALALATFEHAERPPAAPGADAVSGYDPGGLRLDETWRTDSGLGRVNYDFEW